MGKLNLEAVRKECPGNESEEHYLLKYVATFYGWKQGCKWIGHEVYGFTTWAKDHEQAEGYEGYKKVMDVVGLKKESLRSMGISKPVRKEFRNWGFRYSYKMYGFEAKASRSDFQNGFCLSRDYNYIVGPKNMFGKEDLPKNVGLIEVDFKNLKVEANPFGKTFLTGVSVVKRARTFKPFENPKKRIRFMNDKMRTVGRKGCANFIFQHMS